MSLIYLLDWEYMFPEAQSQIVCQFLPCGKPSVVVTKDPCYTYLDWCLCEDHFFSMMVPR